MLLCLASAVVRWSCEGGTSCAIFGPEKGLQAVYGLEKGLANGPVKG